METGEQTGSCEAVWYVYGRRRLCVQGNMEGTAAASGVREASHCELIGARNQVHPADSAGITDAERFVQLAAQTVCDRA